MYDGRFGLDSYASIIVWIIETFDFTIFQKMFFLFFDRF